MAVLGGGLHGVDHDFSEIRVSIGRDNPLDVVVVAAGTGHVDVQGLVHVLVHQRLSHRAAQLAEVVGAADLRHHVAQVHGETCLVDAQAVLRQLHAHATAFGVLGAHDGLGTHRVQQVESHLVATALAQVLGAHDGHVRGGLLAQGCGCAAGTLGHSAGQACHLGVAGVVGGKQASGLLNHRHGIAIAHLRFRGHVDLLQWDGGCASRRGPDQTYIWRLK